MKVQEEIFTSKLYFWFKYELGQILKYKAPQFQFN